jgi:hypothetical protein
MLLRALWDARAYKTVAVLLARDPAGQVSLNDPFEMGAALLKGLPTCSFA